MPEQYSHHFADDIQIDFLLKSLFWLDYAPITPVRALVPILDFVQIVR